MILLQTGRLWKHRPLFFRGINIAYNEGDKGGIKMINKICSLIMAAIMGLMANGNLASPTQKEEIITEQEITEVYISEEYLSELAYNSKTNDWNH
jgi:hypothetical protein